MNGTKPAASAPDRPIDGFDAIVSQSTPPANTIARPQTIDDDGREVAAIESALGEPAGDERGERIGHQVAAGRAEQPRGALRQQRRRGEHRQRRRMPSAR